MGKGLIVAVIILFMLVIVYALGSGLFYLVSDRKRNSKTVKALTVRIVVSLLLFGFLFVGFMMGWIQPHGLMG